MRVLCKLRVDGSSEKREGRQKLMQDEEAKRSI